MADNDKENENVPVNPESDKYKNDKKADIHHVDVKVLSFPCQFQGGAQSAVNFYIGEPKPEQNPIQNQSHWLSSNRGGSPPEAILNSLDTLHKIAQRNNVPLGDLCEYAIKSISGNYDKTNPKEQEKLQAETEKKRLEEEQQQLEGQQPPQPAAGQPPQAAQTTSQSPQAPEGEANPQAPKVDK